MSRYTPIYVALEEDGKSPVVEPVDAHRINCMAYVVRGSRVIRGGDGRVVRDFKIETKAQEWADKMNGIPKKMKFNAVKFLAALSCASLLCVPCSARCLNGRCIVPVITETVVEVTSRTVATVRVATLPVRRVRYRLVDRARLTLFGGRLTVNRVRIR